MNPGDRRFDDLSAIELSLADGQAVVETIATLLRSSRLLRARLDLEVVASGDPEHPETSMIRALWEWKEPAGGKATKVVGDPGWPRR
jgi:hypothetical protein